MQTSQTDKKSSVDGHIAYLVLLFFLSLFICWPLFKEDLITTIDGSTALLHLYCMEQFIGKGQWLVRWVPHLYGYGYPLFNFYPPLFSLLGTALAKTGLSMIGSLNLSCFLFVLFSGFTMYLFAKELWGGPQGGFLSAVAYIFAPYQMVDLYLRGAYAEGASFAFLPLILWAFYKLHKTPNVFYLSVAGFSVAGLCLTHNCVTLIFCPIILFYILVLHFPFHRQYSSLLVALAALGLGLGLAAFFWLPALIEKEFVHTEKLLDGTLDFHNNFLKFKHLIYSSWPKKPGTGLPYEIGPVHCLLAITSLCFIQRITKDRKFLILQLFFFTVVLIGAIFLTLRSSIGIWEHIDVLKFIQFPWRFLVVITLMVSVLAGGLPFLFQPKHRQMMMILGVLALFLMNFSKCYPVYGSTRVILRDVDPFFIYRNLPSQDNGEFFPIWVKKIPPKPSSFNNLTVLKGDGQVLSHRGISELHQIFNVEILSPSFLCLNVFYFPGWSVNVDGHLVEIQKDNPFGFIIFPINVGVHEIKVDFGPTPVRLAATAISFISLLLLISLLFFRIFKQIP